MNFLMANTRSLTTAIRRIRDWSALEDCFIMSNDGFGLTHSFHTNVTWADNQPRARLLDMFRCPYASYVANKELPDVVRLFKSLCCVCLLPYRRLLSAHSCPASILLGFTRAHPNPS